MMDGRTLQYADIMLEPVGLRKVTGLGTGDTGIQYDYFDSIVSRNGNCLVEPYKIKNQTGAVGYVALYHMDAVDRTANIYGKISGKRYYGDYIKALFALLGYAFAERNLKGYCVRNSLS